MADLDASRHKESDASVTSIYLKPYGSPRQHASSADYASTVYSMHTNIHNPENERHWIQFKWYSLWNAIRFAIIAGVVCYSNYQNAHQIEQPEYRGHCCNCYYVAKNPKRYGIPKNRRIDWSYCMPDCVDCDYCNKTYNDSANASFAVTNLTCPANSYKPPQHRFSLNWDKDCKTIKALSFTTLGIFRKDYRVYGVITVVVVVLYILLMAVYVFCCKSYSGINSGASLLVYNVIVSINAVYAMFKPMQYMHQKIENNTPTGIICEVDTINETIETVITFYIVTSFIFIFSQWIIGVCGCLITRKAIVSNSFINSSTIQHKIRMIYIGLEKLMVVLALILAVVSYLTLIVASLCMIVARIRIHDDRGKTDAWKFWVIGIVDTLSISSCIDLFCFPFCKQTCNNYFGKSQDETEHKTYRERWGKSIDIDDGNVHLLQDDGKEAEL